MSDQYDDGWYGGAESRQGEVDELKKELYILQGMHNALSLEAGNLVDERDELQKKVDEVQEANLNLEGECVQLQNRIESALKELDSLQEQHWKKWKEGADIMDQGASIAYEHSYWILKGQNNG